MRLLTTVLASTCMIGMLGGAAVSARAQGWDHYDRGWHHGHHNWRAERDWRWRQSHRMDRGYVAPRRRYYSYYNPPPVYYARPGVTFGFAVP